MPIKATRPRKNTGLLHYIEPLFTRPAVRYLAWHSEYRLLSVLVWGPLFGLDISERISVHDKRYGDRRYPSTQFRTDIVPYVEEQLRELWFELREPILEAQQRYAPEKPPWGMRFDQ